MVIIQENGNRDIYLVTGYEPDFSTIPVMPNFVKVLYNSLTDSADFQIYI